MTPAVQHLTSAERQRGARKEEQARTTRSESSSLLMGEEKLPLSAHMGPGVSTAAFWVLFRRGKSTSRRSAKRFPCVESAKSLLLQQKK